MSNKVSSNPKYSMHQIRPDDRDFSFLKKNTLKTIFLHSGMMTIEIYINSKVNLIKLSENEGVNIMPNIDFAVVSNNSHSFSVQSIDNKNPIIEIVDGVDNRTEEEINNYKLIKNAKKVTKPWGYEIWIAWFKNHHVLKKIYMLEGNKCSLQYHQQKSETNFIVEGQANVLKDIKIENGISESDALKCFNNIPNIDNYITAMRPGDYWDNNPYEIHRVFSVESYTAYEASTHQLDDVIRLKDDSNRVSGFIKSEHY
jgi:hypothetical protein